MDEAEFDEAKLVRAAREDPAAYACLYRRYVTRIYRYLFSFTGDRETTKDLTARVFTAAWEGLGRYKEQGNFAAWLFRIARNKAGDFHRKRRDHLSLEQAGEWLVEQSDILDALERREEMESLYKLVAGLSEDQIELLRLRFAGDLTYAEIGRVTGRSEAAVKMAMSRLLRRLRDDWEANDA
jgi:RNA polymerase sigma-70 factor (ECF subfamily)